MVNDIAACALLLEDKVESRCRGEEGGIGRERERYRDRGRQGGSVFVCARGACWAFCVHAHLGMCVSGMRCKTCTFNYLVFVCLHTRIAFVCAYAFRFLYMYV